MSRLLAITGRVPYSTTEEAFVQDELEAMLVQGVDMIVAPARIQAGTINRQAVRSGLAQRLAAEPLASGRVLATATRVLARRPVMVSKTLVRTLRTSGGRRNFLTNLAMVPKALWLADLAQRSGVSHVHAYWLAHTATAAMIVSELTGIPFSATGYRWDIDAANAMREKISRAAFLRVADELGSAQVAEKIAAQHADTPLHLVRTGVEVPCLAEWAGNQVNATRWCCPGAFVEKKGHVYLVDALAIVRKSGLDIHLDLYGDGPQRQAVQARVVENGLADAVTFHGIVPLDTLRTIMRTQRPIVVLPSIKAGDGQEEGIPVTLVEAMSNGCPVVSTRTGSIPSLVTEGTGWLVDDRDPEAIAAAMTAVAADLGGTEAVTRTAYQRVSSEFDGRVTAHTMARLMGLVQE